MSIIPIHSNYKAMRYILQSGISLAGREKMPSVAVDSLVLSKSIEQTAPLKIRNKYTDFVDSISNKIIKRGN